MESNPDFKEANICGLVYATIEPILIDFKRKTGRNICLLREKKIVSVDSETGGHGEFVVADGILRKEQKFVLATEEKRG